MQGIVFRGLKEGVNVTYLLGKIVFPVTVIVTILQYTPLLDWFIKFVSPFMNVLGLPGEAALPLVLGNALNLYAGIGAIISFDFTIKEVFIMAMFLSFSHNLFIESSVAAKTGVSWWLISGIRIVLAIFTAILINLLWPGGEDLAKYGLISSASAELTGWWAIFLYGLKTATIAVAQLAAVIFPLMLMMQFFREYGWINTISRVFEPFTNFLGIKSNASFTLVTGLFLGLAMGAGVMLQAVKEDGVEKKDLILTLIFLVICHAVIEDTVIFIPLGVPVIPLLIIRFVMAVVITVIISRIWDRVEYKRRKVILHEN